VSRTPDDAPGPPPAPREIVQADLTWVDGRFAPDVRVAFDEDGRITAVGPDLVPPTRRLSGRALVPGLVNAHSHAFQRGLRGRGERYPESAGTFWTWREAMYELVARMDAELIYDLSLAAFREMLAAGITTVGEFHYLHHDRRETGFALDEVVLRAAADAGIRIVLLNAFYRTGGFDRPLEGGQRRFATPDLDAYWAQMDALRELTASPLQTLGVVAHSVRAVPLEDLQTLHEEALRRGLVFHMHLEEQPREIEDCLDRHGLTPLALVNRHLAVGPTFTAVHLTHSAAADLDDYFGAGGNACICPLTEANLADGLPNLRWMLREGGRICLGTDSNARIGFTEEMRWLEYGQRLAGQERGVCRDGAGDVAPRLLQFATVNGARSLGLRSGAIRPGGPADLAAIDLDHPALAGWCPDSLLAAWILGTGNEAVAEVCVGGRWQGGGTGPGRPATAAP
jgi:formimidoylglutamate deiminase